MKPPVKEAMDIAGARRGESAPGEVPVESVRQQVEKILKSETFGRSARMKRFLEFAVKESLAGRAGDLKEYSIAVAVFDKPESFDPRLDPIVRVEAGRLRSKLREYYDTEGRQDPVLISFQKRSYAPVAAWREAAEAGPAPPPATHIPQPGVLEAPDALAGPAAEIASMAVLPFADLSSKKDQEYFCDGITEEIINALSGIEPIQVVSRTSAMQFKGVARDIRQIGFQLNVNAVLEGSVRMSGKRVRVAVQLLNVADGYHLWADIYDREADDIFAVQEEIAQSIVRALRIRLVEAPRRSLIRYGTQNATAYRLYWQGRYFWNKRDRAGLRRAIKHFERAIMEDAEYARPYAGLADCYATLSWLGVVAPRAGWPRAAEAAEKAIALDKTLGEAWTSLAYIKAVYRWDWTGAGESFRRAIELHPRYATAHRMHGVFCLAPQGRLHEAQAEIEWALELEPDSAAVNADLGWALYLQDRCEEALERLQKSLDLDPASYLSHLYRGLACLRLRRTEEALEAFEKAHMLSGGEPPTIAAIGRCYALSNERDQALERIAALREAAKKRRYVSPVDLAVVYEALGDTGAALKWLKRGCRIRCSRMVHLAVDPAFEALKSRPQFASLLRELGLPPHQAAPLGAETLASA